MYGILDEIKNKVFVPTGEKHGRVMGRIPDGTFGIYDMPLYILLYVGIIISVRFLQKDGQDITYRIYVEQNDEIWFRISKDKVYKSIFFESYNDTIKNDHLKELENATSIRDVLNVVLHWLDYNSSTLKREMFKNIYKLIMQNTENTDTDYIENDLTNYFSVGNTDIDNYSEEIDSYRDEQEEIVKSINAINFSQNINNDENDNGVKINNEESNNEVLKENIGTNSETSKDNIETYSDNLLQTEKTDTETNKEVTNMYNNAENNEEMDLNEILNKINRYIENDKNSKINNINNLKKEYTINNSVDTNDPIKTNENYNEQPSNEISKEANDLSGEINTQCNDDISENEKQVVKENIEEENTNNANNTSNKKNETTEQYKIENKENNVKKEETKVLEDDKIAIFVNDAIEKALKEQESNKKSIPKKANIRNHPKTYENKNNNEELKRFLKLKPENLNIIISIVKEDVIKNDNKFKSYIERSMEDEYSKTCLVALCVYEILDKKEKVFLRLTELNQTDKILFYELLKEITNEIDLSRKYWIDQFLIKNEYQFTFIPQKYYDFCTVERTDIEILTRFSNRDDISNVEQYLECLYSEGKYITALKGLAIIEINYKRFFSVEYFEKLVQLNDYKKILELETYLLSKREKIAIDEFLKSKNLKRFYYNGIIGFLKMIFEKDYNNYISLR